LKHIIFGHSFNQQVSLIDKDTGNIFKNLEYISFCNNYNNKLEIGPIENRQKIKISLNPKYLDMIFSTEEQYNFSNYIFMDGDEIFDIIDYK